MVKCPHCHTDNPPDSNYCKKCATPLPASGDRPSSPTETYQAPVKELSAGSTFAGRYQVIEELGKGGMGRVYKVQDTEVGEKVALKLIRPEVAADSETIERFRNELKLARKIRHKNVCQMFDLNKAEGAYYITMEYVAGEDLKSMIRMQAGLSLGTVLSVGRQVGEGLAEAHQLGVVHRDLKPHNIMIDKGGQAKIMDFGIARSLTEKGITGASVIVGTPEYMSPEQAEAKDVDARSDIYSLGIILYEMATGRVPFEGETALSIAMKHKGETPKNPKLLNPNLPEDLSRVILRCLEKDRSKRYPSARDLSAEMERIEKGLPTSERVVPERRPRTSREITVTFRLRKLILPAAIGLAVVAAALFAFFKSRGPHYDPKRIIVSDFENRTGDKTHDSLGRIVSDWITRGISTAGLAEIMSVPPGETAPGTPQEDERIRALARKTGAGTLVSGSYFLQGQTLNFHAQILEMPKGKVLTALDPVSGSVEEPLKAVETLRKKVLGALAYIDTARSLSIEPEGQPPTYEAYKEFVAGVETFFRFDYRRAIDLLLKAVALDPSFRAPLALAAVAHLNLGEYAEAEKLAHRLDQARDELAPSDQLQLDWLLARLRGDYSSSLRVARLMAASGLGIWIIEWGFEAIICNCPREAVRAFSTLDPEDVWVKNWYPYWYYKTLAYHMLGRHKEELKQARQGRKQYPEIIGVLYYEARALAALGRFDEVDRLVDESLNLKPGADYDPGGVMYHSAIMMRAHGFKKGSLRLLDRAIQWFRTQPKEETEKKGYRARLADAYYYAENWPEARALYEGLLKKEPGNVDFLGMCGTLAARRGEREEALRISRQLEELKTPYLWGAHTYYRARMASLLGEKESAVRLLREAVSQGVSYWTLYIEMDLEPLKDYGPFKELIKPKG